MHAGNGVKAGGVGLKVDIDGLSFILCESEASYIYRRHARKRFEMYVEAASDTCKDGREGLQVGRIDFRYIFYAHPR